jgi:hypothetical protein
LNINELDDLASDAWPQAAPNDNFASYGLSYQKQFSPSASPIPILTTLDEGSHAPGGDCTAPFPPMTDPNKLYRGCACEFMLSLGVSDTTLTESVGAYASHHPSVEQPIKVVNDLP